MPGFRTPTASGSLYGGSQNDPSSNVKAFYTYAWEVPHLFGTNIQTGPNGTPAIFTKDVSLPDFNATKEEVPGASLMYKYASIINWEDVRLSFYDVAISDDLTLNEQLRMWRRRVWNPDSGVGEAREYKQNTLITYMTGDLEVKRQWKLIGSWPQRIKSGDLTYTDSNIKIVDVTIVYDWADCGKPE